MWKKREESKVMTLIQDHLVKVGESIQWMMSVIENYLKGEMDIAESNASEADSAESEADDIRREIADLLHQGAFLPLFREDVMQLVAIVDRMASHAEDCCNFIVIQKPDVPDDFREDFLELARDCVSILPPLQEGVINLSEDFDMTLAKIAEVHEIESKADDLEFGLSRRIFSTDLTLAHKMHLRQLVDVIVEITDKAEDAAEVLEGLIVKKRV
jgi:predicted phosphate transport protein (TIGR00153 family)